MLCCLQLPNRMLERKRSMTSFGVIWQEGTGKSCNTGNFSQKCDQALEQVSLTGWWNLHPWRYLQLKLEMTLEDLSNFGSTSDLRVGSGLGECLIQLTSRGLFQTKLFYDSKFRLPRPVLYKKKITNFSSNKLSNNHSPMKNYNSVQFIFLPEWKYVWYLNTYFFNVLLFLHASC